MLFPVVFAVAEAEVETPSSQILFESVLVDRCRPGAPAQMVADRGGPSIALLAEAAAYVPGTRVEAHPYFLTLSDRPSNYVSTSATGGFRYEVDPAPDSGAGVRISFERLDPSHRVTSAVLHYWLAADETVLALPAGPAPSRGCPDGDSVLYVSLRTIASTDSLETFAAADEGDRRRHFEGLGPAQRRRRAEALLATSPGASQLLSRSRR